MPTMTIRGIEISLSDDQLTVMDRLMHGDTYREAAERLHVSHGTIKKRVRSVCDATGARNRVEALCLLLQAGMIR